MSLSVEQVAFTSFKAFSFAAGVVNPDWDQLGEADQYRWLKLAAKVEGVMLSLEGQSFQQVGAKIAEAWAGPEADASFYHNLPVELRLAWQAVARHLTTLIDMDPEEIGPIATLEQSWGPWTLRKMERSA